MVAISGTLGSEVLQGSLDSDTILALAGNDSLLGDEGSDRLFGDAGGDVLTGSGGNDTLVGGTGDQATNDGDEADWLQGNLGDDLLFGNRGSDTLEGGQGNDTLFAGNQNDFINGGDGNDVILGDLGADTLAGGAGADVFIFGRRSRDTAPRTTGGATIADADVITDFEVGVDSIQLEGDLTFEQLEVVQGTGANAGDTIYKDAITGEFLAVLKGVGFLSLVSTTSGQIGKVDTLTGTFTELAKGPFLTDIAISGDGRLFGIDFGKLYTIDLNSGSIVPIGDLGVGNVNGLGFSANNTLYATGGSNVYTIDLQTKKASLLSNLGSSFSSSGDLVFDSVKNRFFATSSAGSGDRLFSIATDGTATPIGPIGFDEVFGLTLNPSGELLGYTSSGKQLIINPETGAGTARNTITGISGGISGSTEFGI